MNISDTVATFSLLFSLIAIAFSIFTSIKDQKRNNQNQLFQEKLNAYKELLGMAKTTFSKYFDIVDKVQFFGRDEKQWDKKFDKFSGIYYGMSYEFKYCIAKNSFIIPDDILNKFEELEFSLVHFVTSSYHQDSEITFTAYDNIGQQIEEIEEMIKLDLNINNLTRGLEKRIK